MPRCSRCDRDHYNFKPCSEVLPEPTVEWAGHEDGFHEWGDRIHGAAGGPPQTGGWGCKTILPPEGK